MTDNNGMKIYLVGGAVRDRLLGLAVTERDWVVVGATEQLLLNKGFTRVGKDFPVFLHPESKEEYALARIERKSGPGHTGFICDANQSVTLEEDLLRRDLTINAIAQTTGGELIDPYHGVDDLNRRLLRHVSEAFAEDPLRILRVARFAARFPDFSIDTATSKLMQTMVIRGDLQQLAPERIYAETDKALDAEQPQRFFNLLAQLDAAQGLWPEIQSDGIELLAKMAPETKNKSFRFAALTWLIEQSALHAMTTRMRLPRQLTELASLTALAYPTWQQRDETRLDRHDAETIVSWLYRVDAFRRQGRFRDLNDLFSKLATIKGAQDKAPMWLRYFEICDAITASHLMPTYSGPQLGKQLKLARIGGILQSP